MIKPLHTLTFSLFFLLYISLSSYSAYAQTATITGSVVTNNLENITSGTVTLAIPFLPGINPEVVAQVPVINGSYTFNNINAGTYILSVTDAKIGTQSYLGEYYDEVPCTNPINCYDRMAMRVAVEDGATITGINFSLYPGGTITGTINDGTAPLPGVTKVELHNDLGIGMYSVDASNTGGYEFTSITPGTYYITAYNPDYVRKVYSTKPCDAPNCKVTGGTAITITDAGETNSNVNISLIKGAKISGTVTDAQNGNQLLTSGRVLVYNGAGILMPTETANGGYSTTSEALPNDVYYVQADYVDYVPLLYNNIQCYDCFLRSGNAIAITRAENVTANFSLYPYSTPNLAELSGRVVGIPATKREKTPSLIIKNGGISGVSSFTVTFYRSATKKISENATVFKTETVTSISPNSEKRIRFTLKRDRLRPYLIILLDSHSVIIERTKDNNLITKRLR